MNFKNIVGLSVFSGSSTSTKASSPSSTSSHSPQMIYDVFISFRGEDNRKNFTTQLVKALSNTGLMTFMDDKRFQMGDKLSYLQENAIRNSKSFVVVLSKDYAASKWCLRELTKIIDCMVEMRQQIIVPVFYRVHPFEVRHQSGVFKKSFDGHEATPMLLTKEEKQKRLKEVRRWRAAMTKLSNLSGVVVTKGSHELDVIEKITKEISDMLCPKIVARDRYEKLVGISLQLHQMNMLLNLESNDVRFVGIVGMSGIGKTTIAEVIYDNISPEFRNNSCFLRISGHNLASLQHQLLSTVLWKKNIKIWHENHGARLIKSCLSSRKILLVLDGVDEERQLDKLAGSLDWFGLGSRVIITTRSRNVLHQPNYEGKILEYNVKLLNHDNAFSLLCKHAFGDHPPNDNFMYLIKEMVRKVEGHPLALIKIGSSLHGQSIDVWEEKLKSIHKLVYENLFLDILKTSYEGLDADSQQIFLDLACFFNGMRVNRVIEILMGFGYSSPHIKIQLLADKHLIEILDGKIRMHILILYMGQEIVHREIAIQQGKQSRIWLREDARHVFQEKNGLKYIQGIVMDLDEEEDLALEPKSLAYLTELKILKINNVQHFEVIEFLSNQLRLLHWPGYPAKHLPSTFQPPSLLELHLSSSNIERLWEGNKKFEKLKEIDVSDSEFLVETPDFSNVPNLQILILRNCASLREVHPSINNLDCLVLLDLEGCVNFRRFSSDMICLKSLETLILSNSGLEYFPKIEGRMEHLTELHLDGTIINNLHLSIGRLTGLVLLNLRNCIELSSLPSEMGSLTSLKTLILNACENLDQIPLSLEKIESLEELDIGGTSVSLEELGIARASISHAQHDTNSLWNVKILNCERLPSNIWHSLIASFGNVWTSLRDLNLSDCNLVDEDIPNDLHCFSSLEILDLSDNHFVWLSESLSQLINLKALYLNNCITLQQLPKLPASLLYVGAEKSLEMLQNFEDSSTSTSSSSPSYMPPLVTEVDNFSEEVEEKECSPKVDIVDKMREEIFHISRIKNLVGMQDQLEDVYNLLNLKRSDDILCVGIFGTDGIGKTSIAEVIYDAIVDEFESSCFLHISKQSNVVSLQHQLLSQLLLKEVKIWDEDHGTQMIQEHLSGRKILIVLDGVDEKRQIEMLVGNLDWFNPGSRVIITTRDKNVLHQLHNQDKMLEYNVKLLDPLIALKIFQNHAFEGNVSDHNLKDLCNEIVEKVGRLPLALKTIGSFLRNKGDVAIWKEMLTRLCEVEEDFFGTILQRKLDRSTLGSHPILH